MASRRVLVLAMLIASTCLQAQPDTGTTWDAFGPDRASGVFVNITRRHLINEYAYGITVDDKNRLLVLNSWREDGNSNSDCAVTRHINNARMLDMSYTGPDDLEGTRRVAADMGSINADTCTSIDADTDGKAVIAGWGTRDGGLSGFLVRLSQNGDYDSSFSSDGKLALANVAGFTNTNSWLNQAIAVGDKVLACGWVTRGSNNNMLITRFNANGTLDTGFSSDGHAEVDFGGTGTRADVCTRMVVLPDGDIIAAGSANNASGEKAWAFARFNSNGSFDSGFGNSGRLLVDHNSQIAVTPSLADVVWDAPRGRLMAACNLNFPALDDSACVLAIKANGTLDATFDQDGQRSFRFSQYASEIRAPGSSVLQRLLVRDDGAMYLLGTHFNEDAGDFASYEQKDVAVLRMESNGSVIESGPQVFAGDGITLPSLAEANQSVSEAERLRTTEEMVDATWYKGNILFIADRARYQRYQYDHDGDGILDEQGPIAPVVASLVGESLFNADFDFDGIDGYLAGVPAITEPAGYGHYCSVRNPANGSYGVLPQGSGSDPCQVYLDDNPNLIVERSGLYSLSGVNWVIGTCSGGFVTLRPGTGTQPIDTAFADTAGRSNCIFTVTPQQLCHPPASPARR